MSESAGPKRDRKSRRNVVVLAGLLGSLSLTSVLLLALSPNPLTPDATRQLLATDQDEALNTIDSAAKPIESGRWSYVFIHHSRSGGGNMEQLGNADHFVIGNGEGAVDGAIQIGPRWNEQLPANVPGVQTGEKCISICLVGDFDQTAPTAVQVRQLERLVKFLQIRYGIRANGILSQDLSGEIGGIGRFFPRRAFAQQLQP